MVLKAELCGLSGVKIYPGKGIKVIKAHLDCNVQEATQEGVNKRHRATKKPYSRSIVGATAREAALREIKERMKKIKDEKNAKKAEVVAKLQNLKAKAMFQRVPRLGGDGKR